MAGCMELVKGIFTVNSLFPAYLFSYKTIQWSLRFKTPPLKTPFYLKAGYS